MSCFWKILIYAEVFRNKGDRYPQWTFKSYKKRKLCVSLCVCVCVCACVHMLVSLWVGKIPQRRERLPTPVFWPGEFHGLFSPWGCKESDTTEWLSLSRNPPANVGDTGDSGLIPGLGRSPGVGNSKPLHYSCLENSMDRGDWQATVTGSQRVGVSMIAQVSTHTHLSFGLMQLSLSESYSQREHLVYK